MNKLTYLIFAIAAITLITSLIPNKEIKTVSTTTTTFYNETHTIETLTIENKTEIDNIKELIREISNRNYSTGLEINGIRYNCQDFTYDSVMLLREHNYTTTVICGYLNHNYHSWIGIVSKGKLIQIEPQTLIIIENNIDNYINARECIVRGIEPLSTDINNYLLIN